MGGFRGMTNRCRGTEGGILGCPERHRPHPLPRTESKNRRLTILVLGVKKRSGPGNCARLQISINKDMLYSL